MNNKNIPEEKENVPIRECVEKLKTGKLPPWKVEEEIETHYGIAPPDNFRTASLCRQRFIEEETDEKFRYICVSEKPYKVRYEFA